MRTDLFRADELEEAKAFVFKVKSRPMSVKNQQRTLSFGLEAEGEGACHIEIVDLSYSKLLTWEDRVATILANDVADYIRHELEISESHEKFDALQSAMMKRCWKHPRFPGKGYSCDRLMFKESLRSYLLGLVPVNDDNAY